VAPAPASERPLIEARLDAVEAFVRDTVLRREVRKALYKLHDLERLASKLVTNRAHARDLCALARSLALIPELKGLLAARSEPAIKALTERLQGLGGVHERISAALVENPPLKLTEGGLIQSGFDSELDAARARAEDGRAWIAALEAQERAATGIPTLKIGFNGVFGYYLEVTRPYFSRVPESYRAVQTLKDRQRYVRGDLRERERDILRAEEAAKGREYAVFSDLRGELAPAADAVRELGAVLAELDAYSALARVPPRAATAARVFRTERSRSKGAVTRSSNGFIRLSRTTCCCRPRRGLSS
jgi:DNA mismatch repair protein MutS